MQRNTRTLLLALALAVSFNVSAKWTPVDSTIGVVDIYIDQEKIRLNGTKLTFWELHDFKTPVEMETGDGKKVFVRSAANQIQVECGVARSRSIGQVWYTTNMAKDGGVAVITTPEKWVPITPGGPVDSISRATCSKK